MPEKIPSEASPVYVNAYPISGFVFNTMIDPVIRKSVNPMGSSMRWLVQFVLQSIAYVKMDQNRSLNAEICNLLS